jgi:hypothetical protein
VRSITSHPLLRNRNCEVAIPESTLGTSKPVGKFPNRNPSLPPPASPWIEINWAAKFVRVRAVAFFRISNSEGDQRVRLRAARMQVRTEVSDVPFLNLESALSRSGGRAAGMGSMTINWRSPIMRGSESSAPCSVRYQFTERYSFSAAPSKGCKGLKVVFTW